LKLGNAYLKYLEFRQEQKGIGKDLGKIPAENKLGFRENSSQEKSQI